MNPDPDLVTRYNYDRFVPAQFEPWLNFAAAPPLGHLVPDFPLWPLAGPPTTLAAIWAQQPYTVVEFGSFT